MSPTRCVLPPSACTLPGKSHETPSDRLCRADDHGLQAGGHPPPAPPRSGEGRQGREDPLLGREGRETWFHLPLSASGRGTGGGVVLPPPPRSEEGDGGRGRGQRSQARAASRSRPGILLPCPL